MIKVQKLHPKATFIQATPDSIGYDLTLCGVGFDESSKLYLGKLGVKVQTPDGYYFQLIARSSLSMRGWRLANAIGLIDADYRGEWTALLEARTYAWGNPSTCYVKPAVDFDIQRLVGARICQAVLMPRQQENFEWIDELSETQRGEGGMGSTGDK